jgi:hypothetical protein
MIFGMLDTIISNSLQFAAGIIAKYYKAIPQIITIN